MICLYPIIPSLSFSIFHDLYGDNIKDQEWPIVNQDLLLENSLNLPIQINGKLITTILTNKGYNKDDLLKSIYQLDKIKSRIETKKVNRVINVQDKIINIIFS